MARHNSSAEDLALERLPKAPLNRENLRQTLALARYVRPYRARFSAGLATLFVSASLGLAFPLLAGSLIDAALHPGQAIVPILGALRLNQVALLLAGSVTLQALASFNSALAFNRVGQSALADLRRDCYRRLISLPMSFFGSRRVGELTSRVSTDIAQIEGALIDALPQLCRQSIFLLGGITMIALTSGRLTAVMLGTLPLLIAAAVFVGRRLRRFSRETQDQLAATNTIVEETLQAIASVKAFANETFELGRYERRQCPRSCRRPWRRPLARGLRRLFHHRALRRHRDRAVVRRPVAADRRHQPRRTDAFCALHHLRGRRDEPGRGAVQSDPENRRRHPARTRTPPRSHRDRARAQHPNCRHAITARPLARRGRLRGGEFSHTPHAPRSPSCMPSR